MGAQLKNIFLLIFILLLVSCEEVLFERDINSETLELISPRENAVVIASELKFNWTPVSGATFYQLQIAVPDFSSAQQIVVDTVVVDPFFSEALPEGNYEWRVRGNNSGYNTPFSSAKFQVKVEGNFSDLRVNHYSPEENHLSNNSSISLHWEEVEEATDYRIQVIQDGEVIQERTTQENHIQIQFPEGASLFKIRAENLTSSTLYSERNLFVDTMAPATPQLLQPQDEEALSTSSVNFEWSREEGIGSTETDSLFIYNNLELTELVEKEQVTTSYTVPLEREETYYWFMKSYDAAGNIGEESEVFSFTINQ